MLEAPARGKLYSSSEVWLVRAARVLLPAWALAALLGLLLVPSRFLPAEDAVILFQYSRNLALHGTISYLAGGPPVEGATDFAWMALIALGIKLGVAPFVFCAVANAVALVVLGALLVRLASLPVTPARLLAVAGACALLPQILAAAAGFAVLVDAALLTCLVLCVLRRHVALAAVTAFVLCLFRPDAVVFAVPLLARCCLIASPERRRAAARVLLLFVAPGVAYFLWRWTYFHELWPLPFLVKADTPRWLGLFVPKTLHEGLPYLLVSGLIALPLLLRAKARERWLLIPLVLVPTLFYSCMRLDQNVAGRFFFYLPLAAAILCALNWQGVRRPGRFVLYAGAVWAALLALPYLREVRTFRDDQFDQAKAIALRLGALPDRGTVITSESGFLPFYSGWPTYDAWGLNTPRFAHHFFQAADVGRLSPDLVLLHADARHSCVPAPGAARPDGVRSWDGLVFNLGEGAHAQGYQLWLTSYGSPYYRLRKGWAIGQGDKLCWFVRGGNGRLSNEIRGVLAGAGAVRPAAD